MLAVRTSSKTPRKRTLSPSNTPGYDEDANLLAPKSAALAFLIASRYIEVQDIPEDERNRSIRTEPYHHLSDRENDRGVKIAKMLPCRYHLCDDCTHEWLNPFCEEQQ